MLAGKRHLEALVIRLADELERLGLEGFREPLHQGGGLLGAERLFEHVARIDYAALVDDLLGDAQAVEILHCFAHVLFREALHLGDFEREHLDLVLAEILINVRGTLCAE